VTEVYLTRLGEVNLKRTPWTTSLTHNGYPHPRHTIALSATLRL